MKSAPVSVGFSSELILGFWNELSRTPKIVLQRRRILSEGSPAAAYLGWLGHDNLGDEAMFEAIRAALPQLAVLPLLPEPGERLLARCGVGGPRLFQQALIGGGTLINPLNLSLARLLKRWKLSISTVGTGVGNPGFGSTQSDTESLSDWHEILDRSPFVSVRGPLSEEFLRGLGIKHVEVIGDPALSLTREGQPEFRTRRRLLINLAGGGTLPYRMRYDVFTRTVARIAKQFIDESGEVIGVALGRGDRQALEQFRREAGLAHMPIENHRRSSQRFFSTVTGSHAMITVRLHGAVLASCVGVPSLLVAYRSKCFDFMSSMGAESCAISLDADIHPNRIEHRIEEIMSDPQFGQALYKKALFWKAKQIDFFQRLSAELRHSKSQSIPNVH